MLSCLLLVIPTSKTPFLTTEMGKWQEKSYHHLPKILHPAFLSRELTA
jgi:hypothetical protein